MSDSEEERSPAEIDAEIARLRQAANDNREARKLAKRAQYQSNAKPHVRFTGTAAEMLSKASDNAKPAKKKLPGKQPSSKNKLKTGVPELAMTAGPSHAGIYFFKPHQLMYFII